MDSQPQPPSQIPTPTSNPILFPSLQPHVWCGPENLKFTNLSCKNPNPKNRYGEYPRTWSLGIYIVRTLTPTPTPTPYLNANHTFGAYPRTWSSAISLTRTATPTRHLAYTRELESQHSTICLARTFKSQLRFLNQDNRFGSY